MATYNFTVRAQDDTGAFSDRDFAIQVRNNLVDRLLAIDKNHAYASVDGETWTERTGKGGLWCRNLLGKWIVCTQEYPYTDSYRSNCGRQYRISDDTINWTENLTFTLSNDAPVYDEEGNITKEAGPLYNQEFYPTRDQFTVINGKIIIPSIVNNKLCIVYSTDALKWYVMVSENESHSSNMMGIAEDALRLSTSQSNPFTFKSRHGLSNIVLHNGKYTMLNNHTNNFYVSEDLIDWDIISITNKADLSKMNSIQTYGSSYRDNFWSIMSINNVLWMMGQSNHGRHYTSGSSTRRIVESYNYVFYTTNLTDINYATNHEYTRNYDTSGTISNTVWTRSYFHTASSSTYDSAPINNEHRQIYYANGVIYAYCGREIITTKTLTNNLRSRTGNNANRLNTITGSCFFEGVIYQAVNGTETTSHRVRKLTIDNNEYRSSHYISALPNSVTDITSV